MVVLESWILGQHPCMYLTEFMLLISNGIYAAVMPAEWGLCWTWLSSLSDSCNSCVQAGLLISGINAEVMPGQWEFQIGPVGAPDVGDEVMIARWLLHRLGEQFGIVSTFNPKPVKGDWNGVYPSNNAYRH